MVARQNAIGYKIIQIGHKKGKLKLQKQCWLIMLMFIKFIDLSICEIKEFSELLFPIHDGLLAL
ncbi:MULTISPECIES: hypothetical protein [unclassified Wolbachia]|uniref:hypothetical protein n=1 Tax=unclassified Wolbachia TaxID=2640676 RepID=UPI00142DCEF7|nr:MULTISPECIES: hypothetical protein [unclassified Wolbachia]